MHRQTDQAIQYSTRPLIQNTSMEESSGRGSAPSFKAKDCPTEYLLAAAAAAAINYPLWRAAAVGQSGFSVASLEIAGQRVPATLATYAYAFAPPYKGVVATVVGMTWARAAIFYGSDYGRDVLRSYLKENDETKAGGGDSTSSLSSSMSIASTIAPPLVVSTVVQCVNMPIVRATITLQDPNSNLRNVPSSVRQIYQNHGVAGLWHGTSAGVMKSVPKYCTAVIVKDLMDDWLEEVDPSSQTYSTDRLKRSAYKSVAAGIAGATLTNPVDCIRNEMFKTNLGLRDTVWHLKREMGYSFVTRGLGKNLVAVSIPVACTIFFTDALIQLKTASLTNPSAAR